jgi:hypothetical protein
MHIDFSYIYYTYEITKFIKNMKKITYILSIIFHLCIKFQVITHYTLGITKREIFNRFMSLDLSEILSFYCCFVTRNVNLNFYI